MSTLDPQAKSASHHETHDTQAAQLIGNLLRIGVIVSLSLVVLGLVLTFVQHPEYLQSADSLRQITNGQAGMPRSLAELRTYMAESAGRVVVLVGLLVLIATPVLRVTVSMLLFVRQRDWLYVALTCLVLMLLSVSFWMGMVK